MERVSRVADARNSRYAPLGDAEFRRHVYLEKPRRIAPAQFKLANHTNAKASVKSPIQLADLKVPAFV